jgi:hypothetical protein
MFQRLFKLYAVSLGLLLLTFSLAHAVPVSTGFAHPDGKYHYYELVETSLTWEEAKTAAEARSYEGALGQLATITIQEESDFVTAYLSSLSTSVWQVSIGGYQDRNAPDYAEPGGGWRWVTGEPWSFTNWISWREPNNQGGYEDILTISLDNNYQWNDSAGVQSGYVVEYTPEPATFSLLALGGLAMMRRRRLR